MERIPLAITGLQGELEQSGQKIKKIFKKRLDRRVLLCYYWFNKLKRNATQQDFFKMLDLFLFNSSRCRNASAVVVAGG